MKRMILLLLSVIMISIPLGCSVQSQQPFSKMEITKADQNIKQFIAQIQDKGVYLFGDQLDSDQYYVLLDGVDRNNNDEHSYFSNVYTEIKDGTLNIFYSQSTQSQNGDKQLLFKIDKKQFNDDYDNIKLFKNNKGTAFTSIVVQNNTP
ncbi:hypothetical protein [Pontibacillus marinus]|uniref:Lipoprotein n=1 Tax=Pontibacillus marinus BH030004 = DSM 16465 TaxID=1385511 RepID=A0A0A5G3T9_9BACI|nr:hypothetical protein [Pontibacillus marinus]KGX85808.1 hypothetical protein N783_13675 [Pontibacillus marinus BH030004 = DSM 16465]